MKRLTERSSHPNRNWCVPLVKLTDKMGRTMSDGQYVPGCVIDRLAAYEDTGLEPEELKNLKTGIIPAHWAELFKAECEGRLLVLPCKVGDTVYPVINGKIYKCRVQGITVSATGNDVILRFGGYPATSAWGSEVVRCRDCKHWSEHPEGYLGRCSFISNNFVMENGYCAWGERKEANHD